jgi:hypothetical protein
MWRERRGRVERYNRGKLERRRCIHDDAMVTLRIPSRVERGVRAK